MRAGRPLLPICRIPAKPTVCVDRATKANIVRIARSSGQTGARVVRLAVQAYLRG